MTNSLGRQLANPSTLVFSREVDEARFEKLFADAESMSIQGYLADGTVVYWNHASELIYGYTAQEALGGNLLDLIIPTEMREGVREAVRWMFENGKGIPSGRLDLKHKNGSKVAVYSSHTVVAVAGQQPVLFCMDADMRALAQAENELRIAATAFDSQQGMVISDVKGTILRVNRSFTEATGFTPDDVLGQSFRFLLSPRNPPKLAGAIQASLSKNGSWQGEAWARRKSRDDIVEWVTITASVDAQGCATHYVGWLTDISQRKEAEAQIVQLAFYDPLTELPNRRLMYDRIHQAIGAAQRTGKYGALLFIDVDDFKTLNDTLGHEVGDHMLKQLAGRLRLAVRTNDTVARFGGDKFIVMLEDLAADASAAGTGVEVVGQKLLQELALPYDFGQKRHSCGVSIGAVLFKGEETSLDELLKQAELAMYGAKNAGRGVLRFFDVGMQLAINRRADLVRSLREGLARQEFLLYFQPQLDRHGKLVGAEVLLRWNHPSEGLRLPGTFIPEAEESGVILPLGNWVLEASCMTLVSWTEVSELRGLTLSVNVSAVQFSRPDFVANMKELLNRTGAPPERLRLELTESMLLENVDEVIGKMKELRDLGVTFSLDDFGTGYSSLSYLQHLPFTELKIDQSFIRNMNMGQSDGAIVQTIIGLGHSLGLTVIAEGVEDSGCHQRLLDLACDHFQGYLFGKPTDLEGFMQFVA